MRRAADARAAVPIGAHPARIIPVSDHDDHDGAPLDLGDGTLGGYFELHSRPPAFEGVDGQPYTVSIEVERSANLRAPWLAYLVFPRWAETGLGIVGHVETPVLWEAPGREEAIVLAGATPLLRVKQLLDEAIVRKHQDGSEGEG
jgi:hypothetical protein